MTLHFTAFVSAVVIKESIIKGTPLLPKDAAGPAWVAPELKDARIQLLKIAYDEVSWLPAPKDLSESYSMSNDDRMVSLRHDLHHLQELILAGKLKDAQDARAQIRSRVEYFRGKSWATSFGGFLTYVGVPVGVADMLVGSGYIGFGAAAIGTASQFISDAIDRSKAKSWLSIGLDPKRN